jgi:hypothetical protein
LVSALPLSLISTVPQPLSMTITFEFVSVR